MKATGKKRGTHTHTGRLCLPKCRSLHRRPVPVSHTNSTAGTRLYRSIERRTYQVINPPFQAWRVSIPQGYTHSSCTLTRREDRDRRCGRRDTRTHGSKSPGTYHRAPFSFSLSLSLSSMCVCVYVSPHLLTHSLGCHAVWSPLACQAQCLRPHHHHHHHCHCSWLVCPATRLFYRDLSSTT
ncbi:hypothetical protein CCHR01_17278 [Colletotrichum chrysophilum]|uniref:Uncharacterized protein n=1 Tax=Colletotrichum chrysophilum TaxID=1836956 RepID=A0AAD9A4Q1_9PEZI|nr:hypothetical protein CCHR01_17278 [Colletotrichum chrysophilum]